MSKTNLFRLHLLFIFILVQFVSIQAQNNFSLDTIKTPLKFKVKSQQDEGMKKKKTRGSFIITFTKDSINFNGGHYLSASQKPTVYYYIAEKLDRKGVWKEVFPKDPLAYGYWGYYYDKFGTFKFYIFYSPKKDDYELYFSHTVTNSMFGMKRLE